MVQYFARNLRLQAECLLYILNKKLEQIHQQGGFGEVDYLNYQHHTLYLLYDRDRTLVNAKKITIKYLGLGKMKCLILYSTVL